MTCREYTKWQPFSVVSHKPSSVYVVPCAFAKTHLPVIQARWPADLSGATNAPLSQLVSLAALLGVTPNALALSLGQQRSHSPLTLQQQLPLANGHHPSSGGRGGRDREQNPGFVSMAIDGAQVGMVLGQGGANIKLARQVSCSVIDESSIAVQVLDHGMTV